MMYNGRKFIFFNSYMAKRAVLNENVAELDSVVVVNS